MTPDRLGASDVGAWMLSCNPGSWDIMAARRDGNAPETWKVRETYRTRDLMRSGQRVLLWVGVGDGKGPTSGIWATGEVVGPVGTHQEPDDTQSYWTAIGNREVHVPRLPIKVTYLEAPVPRSALLADPALADLEVFRQSFRSNPFVVRPEELAVIDSYL